MYYTRWYFNEIFRTIGQIIYYSSILFLIPLILSLVFKNVSYLDKLQKKVGSIVWIVHKPPKLGIVGSNPTRPVQPVSLGWRAIDFATMYKKIFLNINLDFYFSVKQESKYI